MGSVMDVKGFCDEVYTELSGMKKRMIELRDNALNQGAKNKIIGAYERHLSELVEEIEWKIQILSHSCPYDWKGSDDFEHTVQVKEADRTADAEFSPGYVGG